MKFNSAYKKDVKVDTGIVFDLEEGRTEQHYKDITNINNIVSKYDKTGHIEHRNEYRGEYGFASSKTLDEAFNIINKAQTMFGELPSKTRARFDNDARQFLDFVQNPDNAKEMVKLGLARDIQDIPATTDQLIEYTISKVQSKQKPPESSTGGDKTTSA